ncbi:MAG: hypothetical protein K0S54_434 [Alphaproteobacteria bacterium]|nr:hypothetical protein [Alphaproteobacteria bacterium]
MRSGLLGVGMSDPTTRKIMLALCVGSEGYVISADEKVRMKFNSLVGDFLNRGFRPAGG